jgi:hypothetical protein
LLQRRILAVQKPQGGHPAGAKGAALKKLNADNIT